MRSEVYSLITAFSIIFSGGLVMAQDGAEAAEQPEKKTESKMKISGRIYMDYWMDLDDNSPENSTKHGLRLTRTYLTAENKISDNLKGKVVIDGAPAAGTPGKSTYDVFVKNAFLESENTLKGIGRITFSAGLFGTPIIGLVDSMSDYRWIYQNYVDRSGDLLIGKKTEDSSADLGLGVKLDLMKMVTITGMYANGEGYNKYDNGDYPEIDNTGKSVYGVVTFNHQQSLKELHISAFARHKGIETENDDVPATVDHTNLYYGGGAAWKTDMLKIGFHYLMGTDNEDGTKINYTLLDAYVNLNLESLAGMPVLVMVRFAMGDGDTDLDDNEVTIAAGGVGYQFNKNFRTLLYFQQTSYAAEGSDPDRMIWVKSEARF